MKFICGKCNKVFDEMDAAYECENGHIDLDAIHWHSSNDLDKQLESALTYKPGVRFPETYPLVLQNYNSRWNEETKEWESFYDYSVVMYKMHKILTKDEVDDLIAAKEAAEAVEHAAEALEES